MICEYFINRAFVASTTVFVLATHINGGLSIEIDYADNHNSSASYEMYGEEDSTVERLTRGGKSKLRIHPHPSQMQNMEIGPGRPKMMPLYDKNGKKLSSREVYADVHDGEVKNLYYDSEGKRVTIPVLLRDEDFRQANLSSILEWIKWVDNMRDTLTEMREKATSCRPQSNEELKAYASSDQMMKDIQHALATVDKCEEKLNQQLRDPKKEWNYPTGNKRADTG